MSISSAFRKLVNAFSSSSVQASNGNAHLCHYGQNQSLTYSHTSVDRRAGRAWAMFTVELSEGQTIQAQLTAPEVGQAIQSYPSGQGEVAALRALRQAAVEVQAEDSLLHKPSDPVRAFSPRAF